jgi:hypothetical protein
VSDLTLKPLGWFLTGLGLKTDGDGFVSGLASKTLGRFSLV